MPSAARGAVLVLTAALLLATGIASAGRLSLSSQTMRATWARFEWVSEFGTIRCPLTLEGSFHSRTIAKVARALIGAVTRAAFNQEACASGSMAAFNGSESYNGTRPANTLPWHLSYESFSGSLPIISSLNLLFSRFRFGLTLPAVFTCQYGTTTDNLSLRISSERAGALTELAWVAGSDQITLFRRDSGFCPGTWRFLTPAPVTELGTTARLTLTLI